MPFKSKAQAAAAFEGFLGPKMKNKAAQWEDETPGGIKSLPEHVKKTKSTVVQTKKKARKVNLKKRVVNKLNKGR